MEAQPRKTPEDAKKVSEKVYIDEDLLHFKATTGGSGRKYWRDVEAFWENVKNRLWFSLNEKQREWILRIEKDLEKEVAR